MYNANTLSWEKSCEVYVPNPIANYVRFFTHTGVESQLLRMAKVVICFPRPPSACRSCPPCRWRRASLMAGLKLLAFVARYVLVYAGSVTLLDRAEGGIEVKSIRARAGISRVSCHRCAASKPQN